MVVNGEEREGCYFKIVADYIHLNPVRSGWVGGETGKRLRSWRWSSFPAYAGGKSPEWLETGRVLRAFQLSKDHRGGQAYAGYLEARAKDSKGAVTDAALEELRRGWCLGERSFAEKVLEAIAGGARPKRRKGSVAGAAASAHDEAEAERIAVAALRAMDAPTEASQLFGKGKWVDETAVVAALIWKRTGVRNRWVAERLGMGHDGDVTRAIRRVNEYPAWKSKLLSLEAMLVSRDPFETPSTRHPRLGPGPRALFFCQQCGRLFRRGIGQPGQLPVLLGQPRHPLPPQPQRADA